MNNFKILQKVICLIISILVVASSLGGCQDSKKESSAPESSSSESSSSSKEESASKEKVPMGDFAVKYKDYEIDFDEYKVIMAMAIGLLKDKPQNVGLDQFVNSGNISGEPVADFVRQSSIQRATDFLRSREKLKQLGGDLNSDSKKLIQDSISDGKSLEHIATWGVSQDVYKNYLEDYFKFCALKKHNIYLDELEVSEVIVNEEVIGKIDMIDLAKRVEESLKDGAQIVDIAKSISN